MCPLCLRKLTELSVFKMTCLESDAKLRNFSGINCFRSIQGEEAADDKLGTPPETNGCIGDVIEGTSHLTCSAQRTEIYIPVLDSQQLGSNMLVTVKDENKDPLSEGNYPEMNTPDPAGIPSNALDPLETDDLSGMGTCGSPSVKADQFSDDVGRCALNASTNGATNDLMFQASDQAEASTSSQSEEVDAKGTGAMEIDLDSMQVLAKKELSPKETDATEPTIMENGGVIHNRTMAMESIMEAMVGGDDYNFQIFEARIMTELKEIKESIQALSLKMDSLPAGEEHEEEVQVLHDLPLKKLEDLTEFQETVRSNSKYRAFMVKYLQSRCSNALFQSTGKTFTTSLNKTVNVVCATIMCNDLSRLFCMTGRASQKIPFEAEYPHIIDLIFDAVKQKNVNGVPLDMVVVKRSIGEWFRLSRVRGRSKAAVAASQNEDMAIFEILDESNLDTY
ncbi:uncharacterized protein LOC124172007 [Ischnura elegans]|uniref:uncharacterized protein LOC124172007 n=2 Tax=Ischnura elegans TaxID=197161 RepID=UPI001ED8B92A|nr:uncharacterized protein LOC124172007 [Ischnura elegans]